MPNEPVGVVGFDSKSDFYVGLEILTAGLQKEKEERRGDSPLIVVAHGIWMNMLFLSGETA